MTRILIAHSNYRIEGGENRYVQAQPGMLSGSHEVALYCPENSDLKTSAATATRMLWSPKKQREVERLIDSFRPDLIHVHNVYPSIGPSVHLAASSKGIPLVMTVHNHRLRCPNGLFFINGEICTRCLGGNTLHAISNNCLGSRSQSSAYAAAIWMHRFVVRLESRVDMFLCPSHYMGDVLHSWGIGPERIRVVPNFVPPIADQPSRPGRFGLYVGRLSHEKGLITLLQALALADDPSFVIAGDGPLRPDMDSEVRRLGLRNVTFTGKVDSDAVKELLLESRFTVLPSEWRENAPLAALEAMSAGKALVVSDIGGLPELVANGGGITCPPSDTARLAEAMKSLYEDDVMAANLGAAAYEEYGRSFTPEAHRAGLEDAYRTVTRRGLSDDRPT